jgi:alkanesulfonate monooxygenase SsuD/methylene tetrahydromethanopterin reductase-like flavin-dependent oxidoreductase (luciferase family)
VRFGLWYHLRNPPQWERPAGELYAATLDQIVAAEALGYDSIWTSEHHFTEDGYLPSSLLFLAAVAAKTTRVRIGTLILLLPLHHPLRVAEDAAVVDLISAGRLDLGVAAGYRVEEFDVFGVPHAERGSRVDEALSILSGAWGDGPFTHEGKTFQFRNVNVTPKPLQKPLPVFMGGQSKPAVRRAAKHGCHLLPSSTTDFDLVPFYHAALREHGRDPAAYRIKTFRPLYCCDDRERGWEEVKEHWLYQHNWYRRWYREAGDSTAPDLTSADDLPRANYIVGTPDDCERAIRELHRELPFDEFIFWAYPPGFSVERSAKSIELFAKEVVPRFQSASGA